MAYLLMSVTLLHLITLAMLLIATMEKVVAIVGAELYYFECAAHPAV